MRIVIYTIMLLICSCSNPKKEYMKKFGLYGKKSGRTIFYQSLNSIP